MTPSPPDYQDILAQCAKCGACTAVCPVYRVTGRESLTARGRLHLLARMAGPEALDELLSQCLLCGNCRRACPRGIDVVGLTLAARAATTKGLGLASLASFLARQALARPGLLATLAGPAKTLGLVSKLPTESGLRLKMNGPAAPLPVLDGGTDNNDTRPASGHTALYFQGCMAAHLYPEIGVAAQQLVAQVCDYRLLAPAGQTCCGLAAKAAGDLEQARTLARLNLARLVSPNGAEPPVVTTCASCFAALKGYPELLADDPVWRPRAEALASRVWELSAFVIAHGRRWTDVFRPDLSPRTVVYHDPCHLRASVIRQPRQLLDLIPGLMRLELPHGPQCCGCGGLFRLSHPDLSQAIRQPLIADFLATGAELVVTSCSGCLLQWQQGLKAAAAAPAQATHLALLVVSRLA